MIKRPGGYFTSEQGVPLTRGRGDYFASEFTECPVTARKAVVQKEVRS